MDVTLAAVAAPVESVRQSYGDIYSGCGRVLFLFVGGHEGNWSQFLVVSEPRKWTREVVLGFVGCCGGNLFEWLIGTTVKVGRSDFGSVGGCGCK